MASNFAKKRSKVRAAEKEKMIESIVSAGDDMLDGRDAQRIAYENKIDPNADGALKVEQRSNREGLFTRHYEWIDAREITPNEDNYFAISDEDIEALAKLIQETGHTSPIVTREVPSGDETIIEIVDGERRWRAHMLLGETVDPMWYMLPVRYHRLGELSDEDARFMLSAENIGQRNMTPSDRAQAFAAVADRLIGQPSNMSTKDALAQQFGVSPRKAAMEVNIGRHLVDRGMKLLDEKRITKVAADAMSGLPEAEQNELIDLIIGGEVTKSDVEDVAKTMKRGEEPARRPKSAPTFSGYMKSAIKSLRRAQKMGKYASNAEIGVIRDILAELTPPEA